MVKYPNLDNEKIIGFDIETFDPELIEKGTGVYRKDGCVLGVSISAGNFSEYYSFNHKDSNQDHAKNIEYVTQVLGNKVPKVGANIMYELDWLSNGMGIEINGELHDVQMAEPLLCEYSPTFSLAFLAKKYLKNEEKKLSVLEQWLDDNNIKYKDPRAMIYKAPFAVVREYALPDSDLPIKILHKQLEQLKNEDLMELYRMEMGLLPMLMQMRKIGVRLKMNQIAEKTKLLQAEIKRIELSLYNKYGKFNPNSGLQIAKVLDKLGIPYKRNEPTDIMKAKGITVGNPNLDKEALAAIDHPLCTEILKLREYLTVLRTFFQNSYFEMLVRGRLHASFNPLKSDNFGTVSGRFSSSKPNLQNQPSKGEMGKFCRELFIPEEGCWWGKLDYSQIEYRIIAHYARGPKADLVREKYSTDPKTDYHSMIMEWTGLERKEAKMLNFGMAYYMGVFTCSKKFGWSMAESKAFIERYHKTVPFVKTTREHVVKIGKMRGYIRTLLKRRARVSPEMIAKRKQHSLFNRLIQGLAADIMKKAMYDAYHSHVFKVLTPHITVHDELDFSMPKTLEGIREAKRLKKIMEDAIKLKVPVVCDLEIGPNWGAVSEDKANDIMAIETQEQLDEYLRRENGKK